MTEQLNNLVAPLAHKVTAMHIADTSGELAVRSGAVSPLIGSGLRRGDVDSAIRRSTRPTTPGTRTSMMATRTPTTRTTPASCSPSADYFDAEDRHADFSYLDLVTAYYDCRKNKRNTKSALRFEMNLERNLSALYDELRAGTYRPGRSICFIVTRPKVREVWAADFRDRVVHHLLYNKISPRFYASFIADSCACIPGRGTLYAAERLEAKIRSITQNWTRSARYVKCDLANFFVAIHKPELRNLLARRVTEPFWMRLTETILFHDPRTNYEVRGEAGLFALVPPHKSLLNQPAHLGLPIGNLSSQFFANVYLDRLDQYIKHEIRAKYYVRYVDDFVILHESAQWLNDAHDRINAFLPAALHARLNPKKTIRQPIERGVDLVGHVVKPWRRVTRKRTVRAALHRLATMPRGDIYKSANSHFGLLRQASHSHQDRTAVANVLLRCGFTVNSQFTQTYRRSA